MGIYYPNNSLTENNLPIPEIIYKRNSPSKVEAIIFGNDEHKYYFSNEKGHKVIYARGYEQRPMTKREFKTIKGKMIESTKTYDEDSENTLEQISRLNFAEGHANITFEVATTLFVPSGIGALIINIGNTRYIYNQEGNTVLHIDHSKRINGTMLQGEEKEQIIRKINTSKTMAKKIARISAQ